MTPFPVYCIAGNNDLIPGYEFLMNRYWPEADVTYLYWGRWPGQAFKGKHQPRLCVEVGPTCFPDEWSTNLIPVFEEAPDYFAIMFEDCWMIELANNERVKILYQMMLDRGAAKMDLYCGVKNLPHCLYGLMEDDGGTWRLLKLPQKEKYRTSLHLNIWRKDYFRKLLSPRLSPWAFELGNPAVINDGELILGSDACPVNYVNLIRMGRVDKRARARIRQADIDDMKELGIHVPE